jgi:hypothetical protein
MSCFTCPLPPSICPTFLAFLSEALNPLLGNGVRQFGQCGQGYFCYAGGFYISLHQSLTRFHDPLYIRERFILEVTCIRNRCLCTDAGKFKEKPRLQRHCG